MKVHKNLQLPLTILSLVLIFLIMNGFSNEHPWTSGGRTGAPGDGFCNDCHNPSSSSIDGSVFVSGLPNTVVAGETYTVMVTSNYTAGTPMGSGFQVVALLNSNNSNAGIWSNAGPSSSIRTSGGRTYFGHQPRLLFGANTSVSWTADWEAPTVGADDVITFYAVANLVNGNSSTSGDKPKYNTVSVDILSSSDPLTCVTTLLSHISCFGANDGSATVEGNGGDSNYSYEWDNGETGPMATMLGKGVHIVTVTDGVGVSSTCELTINEPELLIANVTTTDALCFDSNLGTASAIITGGTMDYDLVWSNGGTGDFQNNLMPGDYSYTVTDANDCTAETNFTIDGPDSPLTVNVVSLTNATCSGLDDGTVTVLGVGGTAPYNYYWPELDLNGDIQDNLSPGTYHVEVSDENDCLAIISVEIFYESTLVFSVDEVISAGCVGSNTGSAMVSTDGGTSPYNYDWSDGGVGATRTELAAGDYIITSTDANGCTVIGMLTISSEDTEPPYANGDSLWLDLLVGGNTNMLSLDDILPLVSDNCGVDMVEADIESYDCENLGANELEIIMTDINSNVDTAILIVMVMDTVPPAIICPENINTNSCDAIIYDLPVGTDNCMVVDMVLTAGLASGESFPVGTTIVSYEAIDLSGNKSTCSFEVVVNNNFAVSVDVSPTSCAEIANGTANFLISGGTPPYIYTLDGTDVELEDTTSVLLTGLSAGTYNIVFQDAAGCVLEENFTILSGDGIVVNTAVTHVSCFNYNDGSVVFTTSGGVEPYMYEFQNGIDYTMLEAGTYSYTVTDAVGCVVDSIITVSQPDILFISDHSITNASSASSSDGSITIEVQGGVEPYQYSWVLDGDLVVSSEMNLENALPGNYFCGITDDNGCYFQSLDWTIDFETSVFDNENNRSFEVFPNPSSDLINIKLEGDDNSIIDIVLYDMNGKLVKSISNDKLMDEIAIDVRDIDNGIYLLKLKGDGFEQYEKIMILK